MSSQPPVDATHQSTTDSALMESGNSSQPQPSSINIEPATTSSSTSSQSRSESQATPDNQDKLDKTQEQAQSNNSNKGNDEPPGTSAVADSNTSDTPALATGGGNLLRRLFNLGWPTRGPADRPTAVKVVSVKPPPVKTKPK